MADMFADYIKDNFTNVGFDILLNVAGVLNKILFGFVRLVFVVFLVNIYVI